MSLNSQHKRIRKNRVSITYDVETNGSIQRRELPFVVGVIGNFSGSRPNDEKDPIENRNFTEINQDNFDQVFSNIEPKLSIKVDDLLHEGESLTCDLVFKKISDLSPDELVKQIPALHDLVDARNQLLVLLGKSDRSCELEKVLRNVVSDNDILKKLAEELEIGDENE